MSHTTGFRKTLTPAQFRDAIKRSPGLSTLAAGLAERVLVKGEEMFDVVRDSGRSRQQVHAWIKKISDLAAQQSHMETRTLMLPPALASLALQMQQRALENLPAPQPIVPAKVAKTSKTAKAAKTAGARRARASKPVSSAAGEATAA